MDVHAQYPATIAAEEYCGNQPKAVDNHIPAICAYQPELVREFANDAAAVVGRKYSRPLPLPCVTRLIVL